MKIGILDNQFKDKNQEICHLVISELKQLNCDVVVGYEHTAIFDHCDLIISLGGDGTFLSAVHFGYPFDIPVVGVNLGSLGFLTDIAPEEIKMALKQLVSLDYKIEERLMLDICIVNEKNECIDQYFALNELVLSRGLNPSIIPIELWLKGNLVECVPCDGMMVSTPTGSTGYAMAAGGPIIEPTLDIMLITPICPHTLHNRSYIVDATSTLELKIKSKQQASLSIDGRVEVNIKSGERVICNRRQKKLKIPKLKPNVFFSDLPEKIRGRGRLYET